MKKMIIKLATAQGEDPCRLCCCEVKCSQERAENGACMILGRILGVEVSDDVYIESKKVL